MYIFNGKGKKYPVEILGHIKYEEEIVFYLCKTNQKGVAKINKGTLTDFVNTSSYTEEYLKENIKELGLRWFPAGDCIPATNTNVKDLLTKF